MKIALGGCVLSVMALYIYQNVPTPEIKPLKIDPLEARRELIVWNPAEVLLVNMIPREESGEQGQDSEPFLAVSANENLMVGAAFKGKVQISGTTPFILLSIDSGKTWRSRSIIPSQQIGAQTYCFSGKGSNFYGAVMTMDGGTQQAVSVFHSANPATEQLTNISTLSAGGAQFGDEPFIQARAIGDPVPEGEADQRIDKIFVGQNYFGFPGEQQTRTASIRVSVDEGKAFRLIGLEARSTGEVRQDGPAVRPAIAADGTVYVAFLRWKSKMGNQILGDVVVTRDDKAAADENPFRVLLDPSDGLPGRLVAADRSFSFYERLGEQRVVAPLSLAVHPHQSEVVYVVWGDYNSTTKTHTLHVQRSTDRGQNWSDDLRTISSATNPALAVSDAGVVGLLYQQLAVKTSAEEEQWETHFLSSEDAGSHWTDVPLTKFPTKNQPARETDPYLGYRSHLLAVKTNFYGIFSAPNTPDPKNFPQGVSFQRRSENFRLLSNDGAAVADSIDPYFFRISVVRAFPFEAAFKTGQPESLTVGANLSWPVIVYGFIVAAAFAIAIWSVYRSPSKSAVKHALEETIQGPALSNYTGFVTARFTNPEGRKISEIAPEAKCNLIVEFTQERPAEEWAEEIKLQGGEDTPSVIFRIAIDTINFAVSPDHQTVSVEANGFLAVSFTAISPLESDEHRLFIQVFQKTRLVQVVAPKLLVRARASI